MISGFLFSGQFCGHISTSYTSVNSSGLLIGFSKGPGLKYSRCVIKFKKDIHTGYNFLGTLKKNNKNHTQKKLITTRKDWKGFKSSLCPFAVSG